MIKPKEHKKENERLKELESYAILDTISETEYDNITAIASEICGTQISVISLIDDKRQWFKSSHNIDATETPKDLAFCAHAINDQDNVLVVQDARLDERFHDNPLVIGEPNVIFYAGVPLISDNGLPLGTLCVIDSKPKLLSQSQIRSLTALANQVMIILNLRKTKIALEKTQRNLEEKNQELERFAFLAAHDLKSPLEHISGFSKLLIKNYAHQFDEDGSKMLNMISQSSEKLKILITGLLDYSRSDTVLLEEKSQINLNDLVNDISGLFSFENEMNLKLSSSIDAVHTNKTALDQILINLVTNAIKYSDKEKVAIELGVSESETHYKFYVKDNGPGISSAHHDKIFQIFKIMTIKDKFGITGNGIGLATVKKIVEKSGGEINVESEKGNGAKFIFTLKK
ncbi:GAF domain-containing protein [Aurantibacter crassamenti]|uniref:sensor histidine kinase n=1 Tax=Aurantibacter crassamenti TaxID=1837375 RepID=UPI00193A7318|nr:ATP-binding protein [Aurantibacter crassamenti]MBM1107431.1 GAF domain-containing protein [Aurantibacter crassamenti]